MKFIGDFFFLKTIKRTIMMQETKIVLVSVTVIGVLKWFYITLDTPSSCIVF